MGNFNFVALRNLWTRTTRTFRTWSGAALVVLIEISLGVALTACESGAATLQPPTMPTHYASPTQMQQPTSARRAADPPTPLTQTPTLAPTPTDTPMPALDSLPIHLSGIPVYSELTTMPVMLMGREVNTKWSSCGPTALAMVLNYQQAGPTPQDIVDSAVAAALYLPDDPEKVYTSPENLYLLATNYGMPTSGNVKDEKAAQALLRQMLSRNLPVIVDATVALRAKGGTAAHFVVVTGMDAEDVFVNDPYTGGTGGSSRTITFKDFFWAWQHNSDAARNNGGGWWMTVIPK